MLFRSAGLYCAGGRARACPAGTYQTGRGATAEGACAACDPGTYQPGEGAGARAACRACAVSLLMPPWRAFLCPA